MSKPNHFSGQDQTITCRDCKAPFIFTVSEQEFFTSKDFRDAPRRCRDCRTKKRGQNQTTPAATPPPATTPKKNRRGRRDDYEDTWRD